MTAVYEVRTYSAAGVITHHITDYNRVICRMEVNHPGLLQVELNGDHPAIADLVNGCPVELWYKDAELGIAWRSIFGGKYLCQEWNWDGAPKFTLTAPGYLWMLGTRTVAYPEGTANRSKFTATKGETVMKTLVEYNATASATVANNRKRESAITGLTVEADGAHGNTIDWSCFGANLLGTLQDLALVGGGDFDLVRTAALAWEFRWYTTRRGTDRTATVIFSMTNGNMDDPFYSYDRIEERTVALVWGQGEGANRAYEPRTGADYNVTTNNTELFVDARECDTTEGLDGKGDQALFDARAREKFSFRVLWTPECQFFLHYFLGDLVMAQNPYVSGAATAQKITGATLVIESGKAHAVDIEVSTP